MKFEFPEGVTKILKKLNEHGFEAYVIGGAVRDAILGMKPNDYDIASFCIS